ncbi:unnamed protein product, partial [Closterium sp. NIES-53]
WTGKVGDVSVFRVWGSRAFVRDSSADKLSSRAVPCVFLGFPPDAPGWQFYHPTSRRVLSSQDVTFDESVSYYRLFPYCTAPLPPPPLFLAPGAPPVDPLPLQGPSPSGVSQVDPVEPVEVAANSSVAWACACGAWGAKPGDAESGGAEPEGAEPERAESGGPPGVPSRREPLSPQRLREWYAWRCSRAAGATGPAAGGASGAGAARAAGRGGPGAGGTGAVGGPTGVGAAGGAGVAGPGGARTGGTGAAGPGGAAGVGAVGDGAIATRGAAGGTGAGGAAGVVAGDPGAEVTSAVSAVFGGAARPQPYYVPLLQQLQPASPLPGPSPYSRPTSVLKERREPESCLASPESRPESLVRTVRTSRRVPRQRPPPIPGTHSMTLRPPTAPQCVPLLSPPASSLPAGPDPESDSLRAASPTVMRFLATVVTDLSFESTAAYALVVELVDFCCRLSSRLRRWFCC